MDHEELKSNLRRAQADTQQDIERMNARLESMKESGASGQDRLAESINLAAARAVEATLGRILGETRSLYR